MLKHRELFIALLKRDFVNRTSGTVLGVFWLLLQPALQVLALWFLIQIVLQVRFPGMTSFLEYFLLGMIPWFAISEIIQRSSVLYSEFGVLFKRNQFPIAILPMLSIALTLLIYSVIYSVVVLVLLGPAQVLPALLIFLSLILLLMPISYIISIIGVFFKDISQALPFILTMSMYLSPILYLPEMMPKELQEFLILNPVADYLALLHWWLQDMTPLQHHIIPRLLIEWLVLLAPAWLLFKRSEKHIREVI